MLRHGWFDLCPMSQKSKSIETESRRVVSRDARDRRWGVTAAGVGFSFGANENGLGLYSGDGCTILNHLKQLKCTL